MLRAMPRRWLVLAFLLFAPAAIGCEADIPEGRFGCTADDDCPPEMVCRTNVARCYRPRAPDDAPDGG